MALHVFILNLVHNYYDILSKGCPTDQQIDSVTKIAPLVAMYAGQDNMLEKAEDAIRVTQDNDIAVSVALAYAR